VSGGALVGVDNGQQESAERYQAPSRAAFNGKALAIVRSAERAGPITFTASSPGLLPVTTTLYAVRGGGRHDLVAVEPTYVRAAVNSTPALPDRVQAVYADGSQQTAKVHWDRPPHGLTAKPGVHQLDGEVVGTRARARAVITVYGVAGIEPASMVSPVGAAPVLPATARVVYTDGVSQVMAVAWDTVAPERYATPGQFTVDGTVTGVDRRANALVVVSDVVTRGQNLSVATSPARPSADASYSGSPNAVPAGLIDGNTTTGGWSNGFTKAATALLPVFNRARPRDWVAVAWPDVQRFATVNAYFTVDAARTLPRSIEVTYWDGHAFVPVHNLAIAWAGTSNAPTTVTFDPIATTQVRITLTSQFPNEPSGHLQLAELEVIAD
jgi:beta-galactosidase